MKARASKRYGKTLAAALSLVHAPTQATALGGAAGGWSVLDSVLERLDTSTRQLVLHPFAAGGGFALLDSAQSPEAAIAQALRAHMRNPYIGLTATPAVNGMALAGGTRSIDYAFHVAGVPICRLQARAHIGADGETLLLGTLPEIDANEPPPSTHAEDWPDVELAMRAATTALPEASAVQLRSATRCLYVKNTHLLPAYDLVLSVDGLPWTALADGYEAFAVARSYFDVDGTAKLHHDNIFDDTVKEVKLTGLTGDGTLSSDYIKTVIPAGIETANQPSHTFNYPDKDDPRYAEAAAFYYVQRHYNFLKDLGFEWYGPKPLLIKLHVKPAGRSNNALFIPATGPTDNPSINVDDGDGVELQNLSTDSDVVSHEFGHHVIYQTLRTTDGESLVLHEGLADFFAFSRSGDSCLGESICPEQSRACIIQARCLRSAEIGLTYNDATWESFGGGRNRLGHLHGQMISGMLWTLRASSQIPANDLTKLVLKAVSYFKIDSGFRDFILALFMADRDLYAGKYFQAIYDEAEHRGLGEFFEDVSKTGNAALPELTGSGGLQSTDKNVAGSDQPTKKKEQGNENPLQCGVIGGTMHADAATILVIALPLLLGLGTAARPALARAQQRRKKPRK